MDPHTFSFQTMDTMDPDSTPAIADRLDGLPSRYTDLGIIATGGMGEVRQVQDELLQQKLALKVTLRPLVGTARKRFLREARLTAQLSHPGIVSVHDFGMLSDGRLWFTMQEVNGQTLSAVIRKAHRHESDWTFTRLMSTFEAVCNAMAYAHSQGVMHRDLKPSNVMVGEFGEVLVMDWGLARRLEEVEPVAQSSSLPADGKTTHGSILGTPAYMPPEQATGAVEQHGPHSDVYSLGAILYELLCGQSPYPTNTNEAWRLVLAGPPPPLRQRLSTGDFEPPEELVSLAAHCMARNPGDRPPNASHLVGVLRDWLNGARTRAQAEAVVDEAERLLPEVSKLRQQAEAVEAVATQALDAMPVHAPEHEKRHAWRQEDDARQLRRKARILELSFQQTLRSALNLVPELSRAHSLLADHYRGRLINAESRRDADAIAEAEALLRLHDRGQHATWLKGDGSVTLHTDPPGAHATLHRFDEIDRRLVPVFVRDLGLTPLDAVPLERGSYLITLTAPGRATVRYPVLITRQSHWSGVSPGGTLPTAIPLPVTSVLADEDCYVPAGWFISGGGADAMDPYPEQWRWVDGLVIRKNPVTNREYLTFLHDLVARGHGDEALQCAPRLPGEDGSLAVGHEDGRFFLIGGKNFPSHPDEPVVFVDWSAACRYAQWLSKRTGISWRLPHDQEWEKAARGVDGRLYASGNFLDPSMALLVGSHTNTARQGLISAFPGDESLYGVRGCGGNVRDWCANAYQKEPPTEERVAVDLTTEGTHRMVRGGAWQGTARLGQCANRFADPPGRRSASLTFRLVYSLSTSV